MSKRIIPEVVTVIRKGHPNGEVRVNKEDMLKDDVIKGQENPAPKKKSNKRVK